MRGGLAPLHEPGNCDADQDNRQCQQMLPGQRETAACGTTAGRALCKHLLDQQLTCFVVDRSRPPLRAHMNLLDLLIAQQLDVLTGPFQSLGEIIARFILAIGLQLDRVVALLTIRQSLQSSQQLMLSEQKNMWPPFAAPCGEHQQILQRDIIQLLRIIDQQVYLLPRQRQLPNLRQNRAHVGLSDGQTLRDLSQQSLATGGTLRNDDALHRLLIGTGDQRLTQQRLAAALRADYRQQKLAVACKVMQLPQHRLTLRRKELEAGHARRKRVVAELVMGQESFVSMQTGHESLFKSWTTGPARRSRYAAWRREFRAGNPQSPLPPPDA